MKKNRAAKSMVLTIVLIYVTILSVLLSSLLIVTNRLSASSEKIANFYTQEHAKQSFLSLVKYNIYKNQNNCENAVINTLSIDLGKYSVEVNKLICYEKQTANNKTYVQYWSFEGKTTIKSINPITTVITGSAVQYIDHVQNIFITNINY